LEKTSGVGRWAAFVETFFTYNRTLSAVLATGKTKKPDDSET